MNCATCGTETIAGQCPVCGASTPPASRRLDAKTNLALAGWWRRVSATIVDDVILLVPSLLISIAFGTVGNGAFAVLAGLAVQAYYMVRFLTSPRSQTIGNRVAQTRVRDAEVGGPPSTSQVLKRWGFVAVISFVAAFSASLAIIGLAVLVVDNLLPLFDQRRQTLHDKWAKTLVVMA